MYRGKGGIRITAKGKGGTRRNRWRSKWERMKKDKMKEWRRRKEGNRKGTKIEAYARVR